MKFRRHSDTPHSVRLLWNSKRPVAETYLTKHTILTTDITMAPAGFEYAIPINVRLQTGALDRAAIGIGL